MSNEKASTDNTKPKKIVLTRKQKKFVEEYNVRRRVKEAAIAAGYAERRASQAGVNLLNDPNIQAYLSELEKDAKERNKITQDYFIVKCKDIIEKQFGPKYADRISALRLLAQITGHIKETPADNRQMVVINRKGMDKKPQ